MVILVILEIVGLFWSIMVSEVFFFFFGRFVVLGVFW